MKLDELAAQYGVVAVRLEAMKIDAATIARVPKEVARRLNVMPVAALANTLIVAMAEPRNAAVIDELKLHCGMFIEPVLAAPDDLAAAHARHYP